MAVGTRLDHVGLIAVGGADARPFLQGLVSSDVVGLSPTRAGYAALLSAQGRYLHDFLMVEYGGVLLLMCEAARREDLLKRLKLYRLRSKVTLEDWTGRLEVMRVWGDGAAQLLSLDGATRGTARPLLGGAALIDPRLEELGVVLVGEAATLAMMTHGASPAEDGAWERHRLQLGIPDGSRDLEVDRALLLENGFDELNGIDWKKGCYVGQELTARTKYRGLVKKRLLPVIIDGTAPEPGTPLLVQGKEAGEMRSAQADLGLALVRLEYLGQVLSTQSATLTPRPAPWMQIPQADAG
ncbi:MAG: folate-binding protein [Alphaproteobacteria bacterium]|nr:folate-binding protein [Alphaproteobacteria bacterium]